uniref:Demeter RRM-fold domain-containing protein n=1 Tax=Quercus lobata TaxID=97700 RepID=A0A7N2MBA6_QUELO
MENQGDLSMIKDLISINPEAASIQPYTQTEEYNSGREATAQTVRRDATDNMMNSDERDFHPPVSTFKIMRYIFADHESSLNSFDVPRSWIWNLVKQIVYFGTSVSTIFKYDQQFKIIKRQDKGRPRLSRSEESSLLSSQDNH